MKRGSEYGGERKDLGDRVGLHPGSRNLVIQLPRSSFPNHKVRILVLKTSPEMEITAQVAYMAVPVRSKVFSTKKLLL